MIEARALHVQAGTFRVEDVSFSLPRGSVLALLGPSGSGKTLVVESALGLRQLERGRVFVRGRDVTALPPEERDVSYLPQDVTLFPHLSVLENILFGVRVRRLRGDWEAEAKRLAERLQIAHLLGRADVRSLSGGEAQRVALARALVLRPALLCLDETFSTLDLPLRRRLVIEFRELQRELGLTVLLVTHEQEEAFLLARHVLIMMCGKAAQTGVPSDVFRRPVRVAVARLLGIENVWPVEAFKADGARGRCDVAGLTMMVDPTPGERPRYLGIAGAEIMLRPEDAVGGPNAFPATVTSVADLGIRWAVGLRLHEAPGLTVECAVDARTRNELRLVEGASVAAVFPPELLRCMSGE